MNKKFALLSLTALTALAVTGGTALAATNFRTNQSADQAKIGKMNRQRPAELTEAQRAEMVAKQNEMKAKFAPIEAAITAGDYNAWVTAQKALMKIVRYWPKLPRIILIAMSKALSCVNRLKLLIKN